MPLVYMIGIDWSEAFTAGRIMGIKLIPNEMLAYMELGTLRTENELSVRMLTLHPSYQFLMFLKMLILNVFKYVDIS